MDSIGSWSPTYLTRFLNDWLRRNPLPAQDQLTIKNLTVSGKLTTPSLSSTGNTAYTDSGAVAVHTAGTFTGGIGTTGYTMGDVVRVLKLAGVLAK